MTRLETGRLILRPYREDDLDGFYARKSSATSLTVP